MADDKTVAKVRRKLEATSEIPRLEKTTSALHSVGIGALSNQRKVVAAQLLSLIRRSDAPVSVRNVS